MYYMQYIYTCSACACEYVCLCIRMYMQCVYKQLNSIDKDIDMHIDVNMTIQSVWMFVRKCYVVMSVPSSCMNIWQRNATWHPSEERRDPTEEFLHPALTAVSLPTVHGLLHGGGAGPGHEGRVRQDAAQPNEGEYSSFHSSGGFPVGDL